MDKKSTINYVLLPSGVFAGLILAIGLTSMAEDSELDTGPRAIPYNGILEFNGAALSGQADLRFTLTDAPGGEGANCLFEEEHDNVTAYTGRFSVNIGSVAGDLPDCVFDSEIMYIEVGVRDSESEGDYVALTGSQRIHPVPFSYWAAEGSDFKVDGDANVAGNVSASTATIGNNVAIGDSSAVGDAALYVAKQVGDQPVFWAGQFSVDSEDGTGLINLVAGAHSTTNGDHDFNDTRGASRIRMGDGDIRFYGGPTDGEGVAGEAVSWTELFRLNADNTIDAFGNLDTTGAIAADGSILAGGNVGVGSDGVLYAVDSNRVTIDDHVDINNDLQVGADGSGSLSVAGNGTIGSDGEGNLTVNGDTTITGALSLGLTERRCATQNNGNTGSSTCYCNSGEFAITGGVYNSNSYAVRYMRPVYQAANTRWGWEAQCQTGGGGDLRSCSKLYVICATMSTDLGSDWPTDVQGE